MRGVFSFDVLMAAFIVVTLTSSLVPDVSHSVDAVRHSVCMYLNDVLLSWGLVSDHPLNGYFADSWIEVNAENGTVTVWGEPC